MEKIEFNNNAPPGISKEILEQLQNNIEEAIQVDKILYEDISGTNAEVSLSESVANFDYICIVLGTTDNVRTIRIDNADGKILYQSLEYALGNEHIKVFSKFAINQNRILPIVANCGYYSINYLDNSVTMHLDRKNYISIIKVIGYRRGENGK